MRQFYQRELLPTTPPTVCCFEDKRETEGPPEEKEMNSCMDSRAKTPLCSSKEEQSSELLKPLTQGSTSMEKGPSECEEDFHLCLPEATERRG